MIKKVLLKGPILTNSGYGVHTRQVFKALCTRKDIELYILPTNWGNTSWILDRDFDNGLIGKIFDICTKSKSNISFDESYQVLIPNEWQILANKNIGITAGFEADIVKKTWLNKVNQMDSIIVPSEFTRNAFVKTSQNCGINITSEIEVINEWYYDDFDNIVLDNDIFSNLKYNKNILIMGQITSNSPTSDRKNILKTIEIALEFANKNKDVGLLLKINNGKYSNFETEKIKNLIRLYLEDYNSDKITILSGSLNLKDLKQLYSSSKIMCMLSGTRAEGWGLPFVEAAYCSLPIVATKYSSYLEFLEDDFLGIDYELVDINFKDESFIDKDENPIWAEFCSDSMTSCLEKLLINYDFYKKIAVKRSNIIKQKYSIDAILNIYKLFFEKINKQ
tara:strand:- start:1555 stop:2730 length:1176 start_codon:yes stop_codon:yes gene_type:complete